MYEVASILLVYDIIGFLQRRQFNQQQQNKATFYRSTVVNAQCTIGSGKYPDAGKMRNMVFINTHEHMDKLFVVLEA